MLTESLPDDVVVTTKKILADVSEKMKMTNKVRCFWKHLGNSIEDSFAHIVDQGQGVAKLLFDLFQERDNFVSFLGRQLYVAQDYL